MLRVPSREMPSGGTYHVPLSLRSLRLLRKVLRGIPGGQILIDGAVERLEEASKVRRLRRPAEKVLGMAGLAAPERTMSATDVSAIATALRAGGIRFFLGGGWGIDALAGFESRTHQDVDIVLDDLRSSLPGVQDALGRIGYRRISADTAGMWLPHRVKFEDRDRHLVEVLGIDWDLLAAARELFGSADSRPAGWRDRIFATGLLDGRAVPCLSRDAQRLFHRGYTLRQTDYHDLALLGLDTPSVPFEALARAGTQTALVLPVLTLPGDVQRIWSGPSRSVNGIPPHITICFPFLPATELDAAVCKRLAKWCATQDSFDFDFTDVRRFDERVVYLAPEPAEVFVQLITGVTGLFPQCEPYGGEFADVVPHLTLGEDLPRAQLRRVERVIRPTLPLRAHATQLWLMTHAGGDSGWTVARTFTLGGDRQAAGR